jgi:hypothetical protein
MLARFRDLDDHRLWCARSSYLIGMSVAMLALNWQLALVDLRRAAADGSAHHLLARAGARGLPRHALAASR